MECKIGDICILRIFAPTREGSSMFLFISATIIIVIMVMAYGYGYYQTLELVAIWMRRSTHTAISHSIESNN